MRIYFDFGPMVRKISFEDISRALQTSLGAVNTICAILVVDITKNISVKLF